MIEDSAGIREQSSAKHRILVTGAGGAAAINFVRSLRLSGTECHLIGIDSDPFLLQRAETDARYLGPRATDPDYIPFLNQLIGETGAEMVFAQPDIEVEVLSELRERVDAVLHLPRKETVRVCMSKYASFERWQQAGLKVPNTMLITDPATLQSCFARFGPQVWLRADKGAGGKGSLRAESLEEARVWIDFHQGWGTFTCAECLEAQTVTWQSIWWQGRLILAQGRERLYWEFANSTPSGVTGVTGAGVTISDRVVDEIATRAIKAVDSEPHGIFSVDMTYDRTGTPNPTEINVGRFFTTHLFFSKAGLNMPEVFVRLAFGDFPIPTKAQVNPLPEGLVWIRGMDVEPILTRTEIIDGHKQELARRRSLIARDRGRSDAASSKFARPPTNLAP